MSLEINQGESTVTFNDVEIDAIGEVMNISMGAAATAVSTMLDKKTLITTPKVSLKEVDLLDYSTLEPAILVKITYIEGIEGSNAMVFRQRDMQMILNQLMGMESSSNEEFVFDELSISAACEVMNQMMGSSATALSSFLGKTINISTPTAELIGEEKTFEEAVGIEPSEQVVAVLFNLSIEDIMDSEFIVVMPVSLASMIVKQVMPSAEDPVEEIINQLELEPEPVAEPVQMQQPEAMQPQPQQNQPQQNQPQQNQPQPPVDNNMYPPQQGMYQGQPNMYPPQQGMYQGQPNMYPPQQGMYQGQPNMYPPQGMYQGQPNMNGYNQQPSMNVQPVQMPQMMATPKNQNPSAQPMGNMDLIMNVPLGVSIEIGKTKRRIKEILDFTQGTVIELDKQAGAPVDIIVNGQLIARGDVVVIDDNFGVRVTEIVNPNEIMEACKNMK